MEQPNNPTPRTDSEINAMAARSRLIRSLNLPPRGRPGSSGMPVVADRGPRRPMLNGGAAVAIPPREEMAAA